MESSEQPTLRSSRVRRWLGHPFREWTIENWRPITPAFAKPQPLKWSDAQVTLAWLGHATVLINFFGVKILIDPVLFPRIGIRLPRFTIGPKRLTAPALEFQELPKIDLILLSHAHFDHFDLRTLRCLMKTQAPIDMIARSTGFAPGGQPVALTGWGRPAPSCDIHSCCRCSAACIQHRWMQCFLAPRRRSSAGRAAVS